MKLVDPDGDRIYNPIDNLASYIDMKMNDASRTIGFSYETTAKYTPNKFDRIMTVLSVEMTPGGLLTRVGLGIDPYTHKKLKTSDRLKEAGIGIVTFGMGKAVVVGGKLYMLSKIKYFKNIRGDRLAREIDKTLDAIDYGIKEGLLKATDKGLQLTSKGQRAVVEYKKMKKAKKK